MSPLAGWEGLKGKSLSKMGEPGPEDPGQQGRLQSNIRMEGEYSGGSTSIQINTRGWES